MSDYVLLPASFKSSPLAEKMISHLNMNAVGGVSVDALEKLSGTLSRRLERVQSFKQFMSYGASALQGLSYIDDDLRKLHGFSSAMVNLCMALKSLAPVGDSLSAAEQTREQLHSLNSFLSKVRQGEFPSFSEETMQKVLAAPRQTLNEVLDTLSSVPAQNGLSAWQQKLDQALARDAEWLSQNRDQLLKHVTRGTPHSPELLQLQEMRIRDLLANNTYPPSITQWMENCLQGTVHLRRDQYLQQNRGIESFGQGQTQTVESLQQTIQQRTGLQQFQAGVPMDMPGNPSAIQVPFEFKAPHLTGTNDMLRGYISLDKTGVENLAAGFSPSLQNLAPQVYFDQASLNQLSPAAVSTLNVSVSQGASLFLSALDPDHGAEKMAEQAAETVVGSTPPGRVAVALYEVAKMLIAEDKAAAGPGPMAAPVRQAGMSWN